MARNVNLKVIKRTIIDYFNIEINWINPINKLVIIFGFCFFLALVYLLICTKSSPLYPLNDWVDANAFFTMGKGMMNGKILYRDLFEQKGPLLYLIHGLSYLISSKSFFGVFIFEVISFSVFLFYCFKTITLFTDYKYSLISLPIISTLILNLNNFTHGDSAEEFCLPLITISLYYLINYFKNLYPKPVPNKHILINGIIAGCVLWIKFSLLGFWFGWMASTFFCLLINRYYFRAIKGCLVFLTGILIATLPWIIYFGVNGSISEWINTYIILNLTIYSERLTLINSILFMLGQFIIQIYLNPIFGGLLWLGIIVFTSYIKFIVSRLNRICLIFCILALALGVYGGGQGYIYYYLIFSPLIIFGVIVVVDLIKTNVIKMLSVKVSTVIIVGTLISTLLVTLQINQNTYMLKIDKADLVQYKFATIINQTENATILNYGSLDLGFYTVTGITPNVRFFEKQNLSYSAFPLNTDEQNRYIKEKVVEYIVMCYPTNDNLENLKIPYLYKNYRLLKSEKQEYEHTEYYYLLFKKISN